MVADGQRSYDDGVESEGMESWRTAKIRGLLSGQLCDDGTGE